MEMEYSAGPVPRTNNWCFKPHEQWSVCVHVCRVHVGLQVWQNTLCEKGDTTE